MKFPVYIENSVCGELELYTEGLYTVFEAEVQDADKLLRLYLAGEGSCCPLGLMKPEGERAVLKRRLSRLEVKKLPEKIERAFVLDAAKSPDEVKADGVEKPESGQPEQSKKPEEKQPAQAENSAVKKNGEVKKQPQGKAVRNVRTGAAGRKSFWQELPDGCLLGNINNCRYLALPSEIRENAKGIRRIRYKKREYIVFRY